MMMTRRRMLTAAGLAVGATGLVPHRTARAGAGSARLLVGFPPGGTTDVIARLLARAMTDYASTIIVENRSGGAGRFAIEALKTSVPDGSVFMLAPMATMTLYPHVHKTLRYDPLRDFIPVSTVGEVSYILAIGSKVPTSVKTLGDFIAWCRVNPGQATYGSPGAGSPLHFIGVQLAHAAGFEYLHVPYQGAAPTLQDLLAGQIASSILPIDTPLDHVRAGTLRALATSGPRRRIFLPNVPTFREAGYPALESVDWFGIFVPAGTPAECVETLDTAIRRALEADDLKAGLTALAIEIATISSGGLGRLTNAEFERWGSVVLASGFTSEDWRRSPVQLRYRTRYRGGNRRRGEARTLRSSPIPLSLDRSGHR
jgi:tripartite-type tricarboxylate transporter receptor subunit TctC